MSHNEIKIKELQVAKDHIERAMAILSHADYEHGSLIRFRDNLKADTIALQLGYYPFATLYTVAA